MGFLDDVFDDAKGVIGNLEETLEDTGWFFAAPAATAVDLARAGIGRPPEYLKDKGIGGTIASALGTGFQRGTQIAFGDANGPGEEDDENNMLSPTVHKALDGLEWLYDKQSQVYNTGLITEQRLLAQAKGVEGAGDPMDLSSAWARADADTGGYGGKGTSIGREYAYLWTGLGNDRALTNEGQQLLDERSKLFDVASGSADAAARFFYDPTIVFGKVAKGLRAAEAIRAIAPNADIKGLLAQQRSNAIFDGFGKRMDKALTWNITPNKNGAAKTGLEIYAAHKGLQQTQDGYAIAEAMANSNRELLKEGADEATRLYQQRLIHRAGIGDADALDEIFAKTASVGDALANLNSKRDDLAATARWATMARAQTSGTGDLVEEVAARGEDYLQSEEFMTMTANRLGAVKKDIAAAKREAERQNEIDKLFRKRSDGGLGQAGALTDRPLLAGAFGSTKGMEKRAAKERGDSGRLEFVFQSSVWNKGVKVAMPHIYYGKKAVDAFGRVSQPHAIDFNDSHAPAALNNFMKHSALDNETRMKLWSEMAQARTEGQKQAAVAKAITAAQDATIDAYVAKNPHLTPDVVQIIKNELLREQRKDTDRMALHVQRFSAHLKDELDESGRPIAGDIRVDEDGLAHTFPLLETQLNKIAVLPSMQTLEHILRTHSGWTSDMAAWVRGDRLPDQGRVKDIAAKVFDAVADKRRTGFEERTAQKLENVRDFGWRTEEFMKTALTGFTKAWKYGMLLRPAYPMRVLIDSDLRALSVLGPKALAMHAAPRAFGFATMGGASRIRQQMLLREDDSLIDDINSELEEIEDVWKAAGNKGPVENDRYEQLVADKATVEKRIDLAVNGGRQGRREAYGLFGQARGMRTVQTRAGEIPGAFDGLAGRAARRKIESDTTAAIMGDMDKLALRDGMSKSWTVIDHTDGNHMTYWMHAVNAQLLQSKLGMKALEIQVRNGDNAEEAARSLLHWAKSTPEGRDLMNRLAWTHKVRQGDMAKEVVGYVNHYLPTPELREKALKQTRLSQEDLEGAVTRSDLRPPVHGEALAMALGRQSRVGKQINKWFERTMRWLADAPEDQLARHPMYTAVYEQEAKRRAEFLLANPRITHVTGDDIKTMIQDHAHRKAQQAIKRYMFDVASRSDLSHAARFLSPFIAAWEDTVRKWGRIAVENPDIVGKAYLAWNIPNGMGLVVDEEGHPVDKDDPLSQKGTYIMMRWPSWVPGSHAGKPIGLPGVDTGVNLRIPKQAINIVLQGGLQPGFGPLVAIPMGKVQTAEPTLNNVAHMVNPYGPPDSVWDAVAPTTAKRIGEVLTNDNKQYAQQVEQQFLAMQHEFRNDPSKFGGKAPTFEDAKSRAKWIGVLKVLNNSSNPFPAIFDSPYKMYVDAYRDLQRQERDPNLNLPRGWADEQFVKGYGESFFPLVQSMSKNNAGLGSSAEAVDAAKKYKSLISKYGMDAGQANPALIRLIVGPDGEGEFNESAHQWQQTHEISPGSGTMFRDYDNPQEAAAAAYADLGWYKYRQFMNTLDGMANSQGYATYRESSELTESRKQFIANLKAENDAWWADWSQQDNEKFTRDIGKLAEVAESPKFAADRTDIDGLRQYLALRQAAQAEIKELGLTEGSADAAPIRQEFTDAAMALVSQNTKFSEWAFYQYLERDPLLEEVPAEGQPYQPTWGVNG